MTILHAHNANQPGHDSTLASWALRGPGEVGAGPHALVKVVLHVPVVGSTTTTAVPSRKPTIPYSTVSTGGNSVPVLYRCTQVPVAGAAVARELESRILRYQSRHSLHSRPQALKAVGEGLSASPSPHVFRDHS